MRKFCSGRSIKEVLAGVEALDTCFRDAGLTPEPVSLRAILGMAVGYNVSATVAAHDEDLPHLMMRKLFFVLFYVSVAGFQHHVAALTVVDHFENCLVPLVYPVLSHNISGAPLVKRFRSGLVFAVQT